MERCEGGEVGNQVGKEPFHTSFREEVLGGDRLIGGGVDQRDSGEAEECADHRNNDEQIAEKDTGRRKLVTNPLDEV